MSIRATSTYRMTVTAAALAAVAVTAVVGMATHSWIGQTFPGFFVLSNRVVASVGRLEWSGSRDGTLYQSEILEVDGERVAGSADVYDKAARRPEGTRVVYTVRHGGGVQRVAVENRRFVASDYWVVFGSYLATGLLYLVVGLMGTWLVGAADLGRAILLLGATGGIYALTGAGIYAGDADLRLHAAAEAFFPATLIYFATAGSRMSRRYATPLVTCGAWLSGALAVACQLMLNDPGAYSLIHAACEGYMGAAGLGTGAMLIVAHARAGRDAGSLLTASLAGAMLGLGMPAVVMVLSGLSGGRLPVNVCTVTAFMFPLCVAWGVARERLAWRRAPVPVTA
jgi:hypothetical protein